MENRSTFYEQLSEDMKIRYDEKIQNCGRIDPYTINEKDLSTDRTDIPDITLWDIGNHLIYSMSPFTKKMFKAYKSTEAYKFFESGFVLNVGSKRIEDSVIVKGKVKHSQRMTIPPLQAWFVAKMDGEIICAHCTCIAGLSETCSHVAALCFAVRSINESKETTSATDVLCKWNVPRFNEVSMSKSQDMKWTSASYEEPSTSSRNIESSFRSYCDSIQTMSDAIFDDFIDEIYADDQDPAVRTIIYPDEICRRSNIKDDLFLADIYSDAHKNKTRFELVELGKSRLLEISDDDVKEIARLTLPHLKSKISVALRRGRVTGSNFKTCCASSLENPSITTINRIINPISFDNIPSTKYQKKNKKKAIGQYTRQAQTNHENFQYHESGLILKPEIPYFATSLDGVVSCDCHGKGCIEVKCLKILECGEPFEVLTRKPNNILNKINEEFFFEENHEFFYKTQMQIHLSDSKYCDFVIWSPIRILPLRIYADTKFWESAKERALNFHQKVMMPELLGKFFTGRKGLTNSTKNDEQSIQEYHQLVDLEIEPIFFEDE